MKEEIIKLQHNVSSSSKEYPKDKFIPIAHEKLLIFADFKRVTCRADRSEHGDAGRQGNEPTGLRRAKAASKDYQQSNIQSHNQEEPTGKRDPDGSWSVDKHSLILPTK
jgi:hypothetical protein